LLIEERPTWPVRAVLLGGGATFSPPTRFEQVFHGASLFDLCNLENEPLKILYNINDPSGSIERSGELELGPRESTVLSLKDAGEIKAGWGAFQGLGAFAIKGSYDLGEFGGDSPPVGLLPSGPRIEHIAGWNQTGTFIPGFAILNAGVEDAQCMGLVYDQEGELAQEKSFPLRTEKRIASFSPDFFDEVRAEQGFLGWVWFVCSELVSMTNLDVLEAQQTTSINTPAKENDSKSMGWEFFGNPIEFVF